VVAERRAVDEVLRDHRGLVVGARDLLDDDAALAVELLRVDPRAPDEVREQVDGRADDLRAAGDVKATRSCEVYALSSAPMRSAVSLTLR